MLPTAVYDEQLIPIGNHYGQAVIFAFSKSQRVRTVSSHPQLTQKTCLKVYLDSIVGNSF